MATFAKSLPLILLAILLFSMETLARESRFFSKVTREEPTTQNTKSNEAQQVVKVEAKEEDEPAFLPQTSQNGAPYGLYARHDDANFSPSPTTATKKYSQPQKEEPTYYNMDTSETTPAATTTAEPESYNYGHRKNYAAELQGLDGYAKGSGDGYTSHYYKRRNSGGSYYSGEKQGMSDTRFMDKGRYFYDAARSDKPTTYYNSGGAAYQSKNLGRSEYYNNDGYYSGGAETFNNYYNKNTDRPGLMQQQQQQEEDEFVFDP